MICLTCCSNGSGLDGKPCIARLHSLGNIVSTDLARRPLREEQDRVPLERSSMNWFLDWDGTMTTKDTLLVIASIGYSKSSSQNLPPWSQGSQAYGLDYKTHAAEYKPDMQKTISLEQLFAWQESLVDVERASVERVERAYIFANITEEDVDNAASQAGRDLKLS